MSAEDFDPGWDEWTAETSPAEYQSAQELLQIEEGQSYSLNDPIDIEVTCYDVVERPAHRRVYMEAFNYDARMVYYVVREKYVFGVGADGEPDALITADWTDTEESLFAFAEDDDGD